MKLLSMRNQWALRALGIVVLLSSVQASAEEGPDVSGAGEACTLQCGSGEDLCGENGDYAHKTWTSVADQNASGNLHSDCRADYCSSSYTNHGCAGATESLASALQAAIDEQDLAAISTLLDQEPLAVTFNTRREVLQVSDCGGNIVASFTASRSVLSQLSR